jgi:Tfp pilus assembly protein PilO
MIYRRQRQQYIFAGLLAVIAVVNVLFFFILNRPARTEYEEMQQSIQQLKAQIGTGKGYYANLQKTSTDLDRFDKDKGALLMMHLIQRNAGYSHIVSALDSMVQRSGVKKTKVAFNLDPKPTAGLNSVAITIPLEGGYNNVVDFIRELEESDTFFLITNIELASSDQVAAAQPGTQPVAVPSGGPVALSLALETYFYQ